MKTTQNQTEQLKEANQICMKALVRREYSEKELRQKLTEFSFEIIDECLEVLKVKGYQSDTRYAEMITKARVSQRYAAKWIEMKLSQQNINSEIISIALEEYVDYWLENAIYLVKKKSLAKNLADNKIQNKVKNFLLNRGYDYDMVKKAINLVLESEQNKQNNDY